MKTNNLYFLILFTISLLGCTSKEEKVSEKETADSSKADSVNIQENVEAKSDPEPDAKPDSEAIDETFDETQLNFIVSVAEGYDYESLKKIAIKTANLLKFKYDSLDRYYNSSKKEIVLPADSDDEIYAGQYFLRRTGEDFTSIEMKYAYLDTSLANNEQEVNKIRTDTTKMFVFATMYTNKKSADSLANIIRKNFPTTKVMPVKIYMGCMH